MFYKCKHKNSFEKNRWTLRFYLTCPHLPVKNIYTRKKVLEFEREMKHVDNVLLSG